ncbi:MAG: tetratricopeptide repeat protein [Thermoguttaceae bacterium]|nr:tetratricopeptide repeat protein [Thermoguttaceae bacterium]
MHRVSPRCRMAALVVLGLVLTGPTRPALAPAQVTASNPFAVKAAKPSLVESLGSGVKRGWDGLTQTLAPETPPSPAPDPTSLLSQGRASPRLHVEVARLNEHAGRLDVAEQHYQAALAMDRNDYSAMLNYARLKDRRGQAAAAFELYSRAIQVHPQEAAVYNHLGLHYDRRGMPNEAAATFIQAVKLKPDEPLYRNNLAHVLVQLGQLPAAYEHLHAVHGEAVAYYNLGYLLHQRGQRDAAVQHLNAAIRRNPNLTPARQLLAELSPGAPAPAAGTRAGAHVASVPRPAADARHVPAHGSIQAAPGSTPHRQPRPDAPSSQQAPPHMPHPSQQWAQPGTLQQPAVRRDTRPPGATRPPQFGPEYPQALPKPPDARQHEQGLHNAFPQEPRYVEPPGRVGALPPRQSSTSLQQPQGIVGSEVRLNAPYIQLTGATFPVSESEDE